MRYRNEQQEVVEAVQFVNPYGKTIEDCFNKIILPNWLKVFSKHTESSDINRCYCEIRLPYTFRDVADYSDLKLYAKDWIICNAKDRLYSCKDEIFKMTYEKVGDDAN